MVIDNQLKLTNRDFNNYQMTDKMRQLLWSEKSVTFFAEEEATVMFW